MTTSIFNAQAAEALSPKTEDQATPALAARTKAPAEAAQTLWSRFIILTLCLAMVLSALAYGTVHYWALAIFQVGATLIVALWAMDAWRSRRLRFSLNALQWPLLGLLIIGLVQLLPLGAAMDTGSTLPAAPVKSLTLDPYATRLALIQILSLFIYFAAALAFIDSPRRLRLIVRTIIIFGFLLAIFGLIQSFTSENQVYWIRNLPQSVPFGPFINRHHFAGYMELTLALPLGLLFSGAVERDKRALFAFAAAVMGVAIIMTNSRGGMISLIAEIFFLVFMAGFGRKNLEESASGKSLPARGAMLRIGLALALMLVIIGGALLFGGEAALSRLLGTVNAQDPTTGRAHFWSVTLDIIREHPLIGAGLGAFSLAYTRYDTRNGLFRLEQAHNDYLQVLADAGIVGAMLGLFFIIALFRMGLARRESNDVFRRGVALGALAGCFAVLVHSFFDFTLHTTSNALLFLIIAALATLNGRVEEVKTRRRRRSSRRQRSNQQPSLTLARGKKSVTR